MKRIAKLMCLIALVALVGTSCKKQEEKLSFTASLGDGEWKTDDKLYLIDKKMWFEELDQVMLCNVDYDDPEASSMGRFYATADGIQTTFLPVGGSTTLDNGKLDAFFAYYPGEEGMCSFDFEGTTNEHYHQGETYYNYGCFRLAPVQEYRTVASGTAVPKKALYAAAKDENTSTWQGAHFSFSPIGGLLRLKFYNPTTSVVKSIKVTDPNLNLVGNVYLCIDKVDPYALEQLLLNYNPDSDLYKARLAAYCHEIGYRVPGHNEGPNGDLDLNPELSHELTLNCDNDENPGGVTIGTTKNTATEFVFGVRPAAFYNGIIIDVVYETAGVEHHYHIDATGTNLMIKPAYVKKISALQLTPNND